MKFERSEEQVFYGYEDVKAYLYGDTIELVTRNDSPIQTIRTGKDTYKVINKETGEILREGTFQKTSDGSRKEDESSVRSSLRKLSRLVNNNFDGSDNELWLTLTYAENMKDTERLYKDFKNFMGKLRRRTERKLDYICVIEPQERGAWHCHVLLKDFNSNHLWIEKNIIAESWGKGFVDVKKLDNSDNVAAYLTAYLTNLAYDDEDIDGNTVKAIKKGARLSMYPKGVNIFRASRGIKRPIEQSGSKEDFDTESYDLKYACKKELDDFTIKKEIWRLKGED